jgi:hypothetical protein
MKIKLIILIIIILSFCAFGSPVASSTSTITRVVQYTTEYMQGDSWFTLTTMPVGVVGFWIGGSDASSQLLIAQILSAY